MIPSNSPSPSSKTPGPPALLPVEASRVQLANPRRRIRRAYGQLIPTLLWILFLTSCNMPALRAPQGARSPATIGAQTAEAALTQLAPGTQIFPSLQAETAEATPSQSPAPDTTASGLPCSNRGQFLDDLTISDNTLIQPGQPFVKIWRLRNVGTCVWTQEYTMRFFGGNRMDAPTSIPLPTAVPPNSAVDLSVDLTAPSQPGTYQGFWNLEDPSGERFGIGPSGDQSFWVKIIVPAPPTVTRTLTSTSTPTSTPEITPPAATPTPVPLHNQGTGEITAGDRFDLDQEAVNPGQGADFQWVELAAGGWEFTPLNGATYGFPPSNTPSPTLTQCIAAAFSEVSLPSSALANDRALCYITSEGRPGFLLPLQSADILEFQYSTWVQ